MADNSFHDQIINFSWLNWCISPYYFCDDFLYFLKHVYIKIIGYLFFFFCNFFRVFRKLTGLYHLCHTIGWWDDQYLSWRMSHSLVLCLHLQTPQADDKVDQSKQHIFAVPLQRGRVDVSTRGKCYNGRGDTEPAILYVPENAF